MEIKILGSGCAKCKKLEANVMKALKSVGKTAVIDHEKDINEIIKYNIMATPGLVIDGKVVSTGQVLSPKAIEAFLN